MQVYLAKPGGQKQGPFTLEQLKKDLAAHKYDDGDFWAWHDGLPEWKPLYEIPGISIRPGSTASASSSINPGSHPEPVLIDSASGKTLSTTASEPGISTPALEVSPASDADSRIASGRPVTALAHIFVLTTGDNPEVFASPSIGAMLEQTVGCAVAEVRKSVPVDIIIKAKTSAMQSLCGGSVPDSVWRTLSGIAAPISSQAQDGMLHLCLRTFPSESQDVVALLAFYRNDGE